ncbi:alpha/beta fold hydrolase [Estrella lausannensis]|uniref:Putative 2-succinyl-6-hydroxy-2,4-cyclohexadiene-1-carboxylate synthase n=1 Tax=Estrella lausannensis TaxID=483423 RepID=A0A0H5DP53_9BACT|nr:alpha/beta fold hydrolase [Estrella lausannensis]CRX38137.1 Putative 2-succinyl-6-hydroxy-2,4-cyclohexadiene-1-carboxylate synthase [Estrella lausannensis]
MIRLIALHGFLGRGSDFHFLKGKLPPSLDLAAPSFFSPGECAKWQHPLDSMGEVLNNYIGELWPGEKPVLLGYSMGGRLGLQALKRKESSFRAAIFVSTHFGLTDREQRLARIEEDSKLSARMEIESFSKFCDEWDRRPLFEGAPKVLRRESQFDKSALSFALNEWSLGKQEYFKAMVEKLDIPILVISGENDLTFRDMALSLKLKNPHSLTFIAKETNHRVPWQSKELFISAVNHFINKL